MDREYAPLVGTSGNAIAFLYNNSNETAIAWEQAGEASLIERISLDQLMKDSSTYDVNESLSILLRRLPETLDLDFSIPPTVAAVPDLAVFNESMPLFAKAFGLVGSNFLYVRGDVALRRITLSTLRYYWTRPWAFSVRGIPDDASAVGVRNHIVTAAKQLSGKCPGVVYSQIRATPSWNRDLFADAEGVADKEMQRHSTVSAVVLCEDIAAAAAADREPRSRVFLNERATHPLRQGCSLTVPSYRNAVIPIS